MCNSAIMSNGTDILLSIRINVIEQKVNDVGRYSMPSFEILGFQNVRLEDYDFKT